MAGEGVRGTGRYLEAPWTDEEVAALNEFQEARVMHPFTCARPHEGKVAVLVAKDDGWHCPLIGCDYTQLWAHRFMVDKKLWENMGLRPMLKRAHCTDMTPCGECRACRWRERALIAEGVLKLVADQQHHLSVLQAAVSEAKAHTAGLQPHLPSEDSTP